MFFIIIIISFFILSHGHVNECVGLFKKNKINYILRLCKHLSSALNAK